MNLYLNTFLIDRFFIFLTVFCEIFENRAPQGSINSLKNGLAVPSNRLRVYRFELKIVRLCFLDKDLDLGKLQLSVFFLFSLMKRDNCA